MESNKTNIQIIWDHFNPDIIKLIYGDYTEQLNKHLDKYEFNYDEVKNVKPGLYLIGHHDENCMIYHIGGSLEEVKEKFINAIKEALEEGANEYGELEVEEPFYFYTDKLNSTPEEMFESWLDNIQDSYINYVDDDSSYGWDIVDLINKKVIAGNTVAFYDSVDEYLEWFEDDD